MQLDSVRPAVEPSAGHASPSSEHAIAERVSFSSKVGFAEDRAGVLRVGYRGDITILDVDPFVLGERDPAALRSGKVLATIVGGRVVHRHPAW